MSIRLIPEKIKNIITKTKKQIIGPPDREVTEDQIDLNLWGLDIKMNRYTTLDVPAEVTIVVPRAEIRRKCSENNCDRCDIEVILNSITIVHAPRHPLADPGKDGEVPQLPQPPEIPKRK